MKKIFILLILLGVTFSLKAQNEIVNKLKGSTNPEELVSLSEKIPFNSAIEVLSKVSEKLTGKKIVSTVAITTPIGVEINNMSYKKVLFIIAQYNNLLVDETPTVIVIKAKEDKKEGLTKDTYASVEEREVRISAVLFEANVQDIQERGINWEFLLKGTGVSIGSNLITVQESSSQASTGSTVASKPPDYNVNTQTSFEMGNFDGTATGLLRFFETENLGKIISRPVINTINGVQGRTQVGSDFSIKERDFAGNLVDRFFSTGTIIEVTPYIYNEQGIDYIFLNLKVEKSSAIPSSLSTEIPKMIATSKLLLINGEETAIGGMIINEDNIERRGVPILRDLPWWFLGLRYIFGYDKTTIKQKEVIILIKAELLPTLKERAMQKKEDILKKSLEKQQNDMDKIQNSIKEFEKEQKQKLEEKKEG